MKKWGRGEKANRAYVIEPVTPVDNRSSVLWRESLETVQNIPEELPANDQNTKVLFKTLGYFQGH